MVTGVVVAALSLPIDMIDRERPWVFAWRVVVVVVLVAA